MFVWRSRQTADAAQEEIDESLAAMAEYDRLHLPFSNVWAETRDWLEVPMNDAPARKVEARLGIAAYEVGTAIHFHGFAEIEGDFMMSVLEGTVDRSALTGRRNFDFTRPAPAAIDPNWDEAAHRRISRACGERLLELLFLLSTRGVARETVHQGSGKPGKKNKGQRRMSARDFVVVRVPLHYVGSEDGSAPGATGRWVRPHVRRAHMWGKNTRSSEEQHWRDACLVGAAKLGEGVEVRRPEYRVG
jgi:hypothetical protein